MINGYVSQVGRSHGIPTPFNDTVVDIVTKIEMDRLPLSTDNLKHFDDEWFSFAPVSYTHLDVYKRQGYHTYHGHDGQDEHKGHHVGFQNVGRQIGA